MLGNRRNFIQRLTAAGATGLAGTGVLRSEDEGEGRVVTYNIKGFTCVTCAVGLEVLLRQRKGVSRAKASYAERQVVIRFDPAVVAEDEIKQFISTTGFTVDEEPKS